MSQDKTKSTKPRRSQEEIKAARIERENRLAEKAAARQERFAAAAAKAAEKAEAARLKAEQIASNTSGRAPKAEVPVIKETVAKRVTREVSQFFKELGVKHQLTFDEVTPRMTRQGSALSLRVSGHAEGIIRAAKRAAGATREAARFMEQHKLVGIKQSVLGKEIQLAGENGTFKVLGMKGRSNSIVLQKVGSDKIRSVPADEFKSHMVSA